MSDDSTLARWLNDETPGIYIWKARIGWRFRVMTQLAGTVAVWRLTHRGAVQAAERIAREEA